MNWGKKIIIGLACFMIFILGLGTAMILKSDDDALIESNYYENGQTYDKKYAAIKQAVTDGKTPLVTTDQSGANIRFPVPVKYKLTCKRLSDSRMDKIFAGETGSDGNILLSGKDLQKGPWLIAVEYSVEDKNYLFEGEIRMP